MFVFERRFHRGMMTLLVIQVILSFFTIYLLERMAHSETRVPIEVDLGLRRSMNTLMNLLQHPDPDFTNWNDHWSKGLAETGQMLQESKHPAALFLPLSQLDSRVLHEDLSSRLQAEQTIVDLAKAYDSHWTQTQKTFRLTVVGGAWSVTLISLIGFVSLAYIHNQTKRYMILPLREICQCLIDWKRGNQLRRCSVAGIDPNVQRSLDILNRCLDEYRPLKVMAPIERELADHES